MLLHAQIPALRGRAPISSLLYLLAQSNEMYYKKGVVGKGGGDSEDLFYTLAPDAYHTKYVPD